MASTKKRKLEEEEEKSDDLGLCARCLQPNFEAESDDEDDVKHSNAGESMYEKYDIENDNRLCSNCWTGASTLTRLRWDSTVKLRLLKCNHGSDEFCRFCDKWSEVYHYVNDMRFGVSRSN
jgi:hypothetical protein